ncbi:4442_t:CDS:2, partial [Entrophospora sp. SA101]
AIVSRSILEYHENEVQERILILSTFSHLYFITLRFSIYGFPTYKVVLFAVLDKVKSDHKELENILNILKPSPPSNKDKSTETSRFVFYLYLKDKSEIRLYESVHVVILAMFSTKKRISPKLSPFYCNLLLQAYPDLLTVGQLRAAYSIVIRSLSETDDALAWVCLEKLIKAIENLPTTDNIYILQYTNDGSLREYLAKNKENLKWVDKLRLAKDIAAGLKILHDNDIFHGELDDAVSSTTPSYKISVPGIIPYIDPQTFAKRSSPRTHNLQKPREQQQQIKKNDDDEYLNHLKSDIYSLGVILWEISTNKIPFDDSKNQVLLTVSIMIRNKRELPAEVNAEVNDEVNDKVNDEVNAEVNDKDFLVRDKRSSHMETIGDLTTTLSSSSSYRLIKSKSETPENISMNPSTQLQTKDENLDSKPIPKNTLTSKSPCQRFKYI